TQQGQQLTAAAMFLKSPVQRGWILLLWQQVTISHMAFLMMNNVKDDVSFTETAESQPCGSQNIEN
ncbi:MAG: hypothetical protein ACI377_11180, partial [Bacteroides fragilis]